MNSADFDGSGSLFALNADQSGVTDLVVINTTVGSVAARGNILVADLDALAILRTPQVPEPAGVVLLLVGGLALAGHHCRRWAYSR
jgi:hypothetical protein